MLLYHVDTSKAEGKMYESHVSAICRTWKIGQFHIEKLVNIGPLGIEISSITLKLTLFVENWIMKVHTFIVNLMKNGVKFLKRMPVA